MSDIFVEFPGLHQIKLMAEHSFDAILYGKIILLWHFPIYALYTN